MDTRQPPTGVSQSDPGVAPVEAEGPGGLLRSQNVREVMPQVGPHLQAVVAPDDGQVIDELPGLADLAVRQIGAAAQADVGGSWDSPVETLRVNVEGTLNVCDAARLAGAQRVLGITSADVYGHVDQTDPDGPPLDETTPLRPLSPYAASKAAAEYIYLQAGLGHGLDVVLARSFNHLGPGQSDRFVASAIAGRIAANERSGTTAVSIGNLEARRDFTDVRDVVRAYRLLIEHGTPGDTYHVCSGRDRSIREIAEQLVGLAAFPMTLEPDPALCRPVDLKVLCGDNTKIRTQTGWEPQIPIETTLSDLLEFWRHNPDGVETPQPR